LTIQGKYSHTEDWHQPSAAYQDHKSTSIEYHQKARFIAFVKKGIFTEDSALRNNRHRSRTQQAV